MEINRHTKIEDLPEFLTPVEFSAVLGLSRSSTYELIRTGQVEHKRFGRRVFIPKTVLGGVGVHNGGKQVS